MFDAVTCGFLNKHSFQLMEYAVMRPCPSDLPDSRQPGDMWLLCGAAELKPLSEVIWRLVAWQESHLGLRYLKTAEGCTCVWSSLTDIALMCPPVWITGETWSSAPSPLSLCWTTVYIL